MGEIKKPTFQRPSSWWEWLTGRQGQAELLPSVQMIFPTYEQGPFEKNIIQLRAVATGDGNPVTFTFPGLSNAVFPTFRVRNLYILNQITTVTEYRLTQLRQLEDGTTYTVLLAHVSIEGGDTFPLVGGSGAPFSNTLNQNTHFVAPPFVCWRDRNAQPGGDTFTVTSDISITAARVVAMFAELEIIPAPAEFRDLSGQVFVTN